MPLHDVDLKKTVNLPKTDFPMKANLAQAEPKMLARWEDEKLYDRIRAARHGAPRYVLHDGPPYANGNIHLGHTFNKLLKDFVVKSKTMQGFDSPYIPGWDCHGLPTEIKVDAELGAKKAQMTTAQIRGACRRYAQKYVDLQSKDFQRLGVFGRWSDPYLTMSAEYEGVIAGTFVDFLDRGYVYKGLKPVNWCISCRTALAEAEVEYENHSSPSVWVRFAMVSDPGVVDPALRGRRTYGLIWTTTPWTVPANMAISFHPKFTYVAVEVGKDTYIVAKELLASTAEAAGWPDDLPVVAEFPGEKLEGAHFKHPFLDRQSLGIVGDHVTLEAGTGAVHTAPGHGQDDYVIGRRYRIETYCPVDDAGRFFDADGADGKLPDELIGKTVWEGNMIVIRLLEEYGALVAQRKINHSYPHCWRCHNPTIFRATEQWFIGMDRNALRAQALSAIKNVKWQPGWGEERISNMIATRPDWCISRQRVWGVPIPVFYCEDCAEAITGREKLDPVVARFRAETADVWYKESAQDLLGADYRCAKCGSSNFRKETDILDVWFESGASHLAVLTEKNDLGWPSDMYLEGGDQYRGWFHSSLLIGVALKGAAPYRECATNGWTLDADGRAMSKSRGNVIEPEKIIKQYGAEVLRLWVGSVAFHEDVRLSDTILTRLSEAYRKIRNTFKYTLGNLQGFDPARDMVPVNEMLELDAWILMRTEDVVQKCIGWYNDLEFHRAYQAVYNLATTDLSARYFDIVKDRLYTTAPNSFARRSAQSALWLVTHALVRTLAPVLAFTTEEVWAHLARPSGSPESVHLAHFPEPGELSRGLTEERRERLSNWERLNEVRDTVLKSLEEARQEKVIGAPLEATVSLKANDALYRLLLEYEDSLPALFITSGVMLERHDESELSVAVSRAPGDKCERCWKYKSDVGGNAEFPTICVSCSEAVLETVAG